MIWGPKENFIFPNKKIKLGSQRYVWDPQRWDFTKVTVGISQLNFLFAKTRPVIGPLPRNVGEGLISHKIKQIRPVGKTKCGENRNHGKFKIYFLMVEL